MRWNFKRTGAVLLGLCLLFGMLTAQAASRPDVDASELPALAADADLPQLSTRLETIRQRVTADNADDDLAALRQASLDVQQAAAHQVDDLSTRLSRVEDQLNVLGPPSDSEAATLALQRNDLQKQKSDLQDQQKQAGEIGQSAQNLAAQIVNLRRSLFNSQIATRSAPPLSPRFWSTLTRPTPDDLARLQGLGVNLKSQLAAAWQNQRLPLLACLLGALLLWIPGQRLLERWLSRAVNRWLPEGRLRRSALALAIGLISVATFGGSAALLHLGLDWDGRFDGDLASLADQMVTLAVFCAFIAGLGRALLMVQRPSWRLLPLPDHLAKALSPFPWLLAILLMLLGSQERINNVIGTSLALTVAVNGLTALMVSVLFGVALVRYRSVHRHDGEEDQTPALARLIFFGVLMVVLFTLLALLSGYLSLAYFLAAKLLWVSVVSVTGYLLTAFFGDLCEGFLSPRQAAGKTLARALGLNTRHLAQASTLLAGLGRTLLVLLTLLIAFTPTTGNSGELFSGELLTGLLRLVQGDQVLGNLNIVPSTILIALLTLVVGLFALRLLKRWLSEELLPETTMDAGMRASLVTLVGYLGIVFLALITLSVLRINLTSLTWVVSALSVGIGFGLQAIVQNFISGLILLTERPVKVGDWVSLTGVEGDIRRINVRATEIQQSDNSTVIVPNSQLITQNVRNVTMGGALGSVGITLTLPLDTDVLKVRELLLAAYAEHQAILDTPAPSVAFTLLTDQGLTLAASGYVGSPRAVYRTRSDLLFAVFGQLRSHGISLITPRSLKLLPEAPTSMPSEEDAGDPPGGPIPST
ncbi:MAG: Miniconductance mechanosensitive channel MscM [Stenotrophomonas maltophilia]|nr:MAG: Miniconductance mechanosensitive channel MscM [Stenotrophomonas maltophilia]